MRFIIAAVLVPMAVAAAQQSPAALQLTATIPMPNVSGRIDHLGVDEIRQRLFVAALGNDTVEVIDASSNAVAIANGNTGTLQLVDATTLQTRWTIPIGGDADNVRYDAAAKRLLVAYEGGIAIVDPPAAPAVQPIALSGPPQPV